MADDSQDISADTQNDEDAQNALPCDQGKDAVRAASPEAAIADAPNLQAPGPARSQSDLDDFIKLFEVHREYIKVEHGLEHERTTWHLAIQGFLFAFLGIIGEWQLETYLVFERRFLPYILALIGVIVAAVSLISLRGAEKALDRVAERWENVAANPKYRGFVDLLPGISGGGKATGAAIQRSMIGREWLQGLGSPKMMGKIELLAIPWIIIVAWVFVTGIYSWDHFHSTQNSQPLLQLGTCNTRLSGDSSAADIASAESCSLENANALGTALRAKYRREVNDGTTVQNPPVPALVADPKGGRVFKCPNADEPKRHRSHGRIPGKE